MLSKLSTRVQSWRLKMISVVIGGTFGAVLALRGLLANVGTGLAHGFMWWVPGPLTLMPAFMGIGLGVNWNVAAMSEAMPSLVGHLVLGAILGVTVAVRRIAARSSGSISVT